MQTAITIFWLRRDLRLHDNHGLFKALSAGLPVLPLFIFDTNILSHLEDRADRRVAFIYNTLQGINQKLARYGSTLEVQHGSPEAVFQNLLQRYSISAVFANHDYEPYARKRDERIAALLAATGITFTTYKDQVIFEKSEVVKADGSPYGMFTPYARKWKTQLGAEACSPFETEKHGRYFYQQPYKALPALEELGFTATTDALPRLHIDEEIIGNYQQTRDYPALQGTTRLGLHLRFGTVSVRHLVQRALVLNETFLGELIWREFFMQLLWHQPRLETECCKPQYEAIRWRNNEAEFERWCAGQTGYPLVDAGMRQLNATGFMHNRVRMVTASFLVKHLLVDWRWGEAYFARHLLDFDLAANNGNWQWVAGCGCDAAPYFRVFNPAAQAVKFDKQEAYIKHWVPEYGTQRYPKPMVVHETARQRCLAVYKEALQQKTIA